MTVFDGFATWQVFAVFGAAGAGVVGAGIVLARSGDAIATRTGLGGLFVGMLFLAAATSLPEIVTDVTAAAAGAPALAIGDLFGSSMANMAILGIVDLVHRGRVWPGAGLGHARVAAIAIALTALVVLGLVAPTGIAVGWVGVVPIVAVLGYVLAARWIHDAQRSALAPREPHADPGAAPEPPAPRPSLARLVATFIGASLVIVVAAPVMALAAEAISVRTGIAETVVGATLLAIATSLPELVTSLAAVQIGAFDLAVGNLFGSNALNMTVVLFADAAYTPGPILEAVPGSAPVVAGLGAILLMAIAIGGIVHGARTRFERGEPDAVLVLLTYGLVLWLLWSAA